MDDGIHLAKTDEEMQAIYRLLYRVYIEEMEGAERHEEADRDLAQFRDEWDATAQHLYAVRGGEVVGCVRTNLRRDGPVECEEFFDFERFSPYFPDHVSLSSRLAIDPARRGTVLMSRLIDATFELFWDNGVKFAFLDCHPRLVPTYARLGWRIYKGGFRHPKYLWVVPMVFVVDDLEYMEAVGSPLVRLARRHRSSTECRELLESRFPAARRTVVPDQQSPGTTWARLESQLLDTATRDAGGSLFAGCRDDQVAAMLDAGHVVACHAGDVVLAPGDEGRELFVILEGSFEVVRAPQQGGRPHVLRVLGQGDVFGEVAFLTSGVRGAAVQAMTDGSVLILNGRALDKLADRTPELAVTLFRNLARVLATRLVDTSAMLPD